MLFRSLCLRVIVLHTYSKIAVCTNRAKDNWADGKVIFKCAIQNSVQLNGRLVGALENLKRRVGRRVKVYQSLVRTIQLKSLGVEHGCGFCVRIKLSDQTVSVAAAHSRNV